MKLNNEGVNVFIDMERVSKFISFDGYEFDNEQSCLAREQAMTNRGKEILADMLSPGSPFQSTKLQLYSNLINDMKGIPSEDAWKYLTDIWRIGVYLEEYEVSCGESLLDSDDLR